MTTEESGPLPPEESRSATLGRLPRDRDEERLAALRPRVLGCLLGGAVGDALGNPVEFLSLGQIRHRFGPGGLTTMVSDEVTDDTQMTLFTAEGLIRRELHGTDTVTSVRNAYLRWLDTQE